MRIDATAFSTPLLVRKNGETRWNMVRRGLRLSLDALGATRRRLNGFCDKRRDTYRGNTADATIYLNKIHDVSSVQGVRSNSEENE